MKTPAVILSVALSLALTRSSLAQAPAAATPTPAATAPVVVSPEVGPDRRVTFRLWAPKATAVTLKGDWHDDALPLVKDEKGVWSVTLGPLAPSKYIYNFYLDGVMIADPANAQVKLRQLGQGSFFNVPAESPGVGDARDVPHGTIEVNAQKSVVLSDTRSFLVYMPPGYAQESDRRYPVLYLMHGANDRPQGWVDIGNINYIADNLIAEGKAEPMIIVMPVAHAVSAASRAEGLARNAVVFEEYLLRDVMPAVEAKYRVAAGRQHRAVAGFSMGGDLAMRVFANHVDLFSAVGLFSPSSAARLVPKEKPAVFADAKAFNAQVDVLYFACGRQDRLFSTSQSLDEALTQLGIAHLWKPTDGYHNYALWRQHVAEFLPMIFHPNSPAARAAAGK